VLVGVLIAALGWTVWRRRRAASASRLKARAFSRAGESVRDAYLLFDTRGLVRRRLEPGWPARGAIADPNPAATRAQLLRSAPGALEARPSPIAPIAPIAQQAIDAIGGLLRGERVDLGALPLDLRGVPPLHARVYAIVRRIPCGRTLTYGQVAEALGDRQLARAVGRRWRATASPGGALPPSRATAAQVASRPAAACACCSCCRSRRPAAPEPDLFGDAPNKR
jgi:hypothetical protein